MHVVAFHSYKGGTGKTTLAANYAVLRAKRGENVCILDFDFRAPSLQVLFKCKPMPRYFLNNYLDGKCKIDDVVCNFQIEAKGAFHVGFADHSSLAMREMMKKDREWEATALKKILAAKRRLRDLGVQCLILDTSPGMNYSSANALAASDFIGLVLKGDEFDTEGTVELIKGMYQKLGKKTGIILNRVLFSRDRVYDSVANDKFIKKLETLLEYPVLGTIPCYCDVMIDSPKLIHALKDPKHPFVQTMKKISGRIDAFS